MFGKPDWFRKKKIGWGLTPTSWQGWVYTCCWSAVMVGPFLLLLARQQVPEAVVWMACAVALLVWDAWKIRQAMEREERKSMLFIGDDEAEQSLETRSFDFHLRD